VMEVVVAVASWQIMQVNNLKSESEHIKMARSKAWLFPVFCSLLLFCFSFLD